MDHSPFEGFFKLLLPILIFIAWPMFSNAQKRKKEQEALKRRRQQEAETAAQIPTEIDYSPSEQKQEQAVNPKDSRSRSLEDILEELGFPIEQEKAPTPKPASHPVEKTAPPREMPEESPSLEDLKPEVVSKKAPDEKMKAHLAIQEGAYTLSASPIDNQKAYLIETSIADGGSEVPHEPIQTAYASAGDLQKFIVWSELLGKPVALKDDGRWWLV
jgi:hypothetical protein